MLDFNRTERRALAASVFLVGLGAISRLLWMPPPADSRWQVLEAGGAAGPQREAVAEAVAREARVRTPLEEGEQIDVATASTVELRRLPGVGPSLAEAIVRERATRPFRSKGDLERVPGIGPATLARLSDRVRVSTEGTQDPSNADTPAARTTASSCSDGSIDPNAATAGELETLPGVGPALAARILQYRAENGRFADPTGLQGVAGIGPAKVEALSSHLCVR